MLVVIANVICFSSLFNIHGHGNMKIEVGKIQKTKIDFSLTHTHCTIDRAEDFPKHTCFQYQ